MQNTVLSNFHFLRCWIILQIQQNSIRKISIVMSCIAFYITCVCDKYSDLVNSSADILDKIL